MKQALNNFVDLLVKGDFLLVLLVVMILVIISVIFYLVKLELGQRSYFEDDEDEEENVTALIDNVVEEPVINSIIEDNDKDIKKDNIVNYENNDIIDEVRTYENDQEEVAIISAAELDNRLKQIENAGEVNLHEKEIERYENEQEEKAIISYEELLKRASTGIINYEKPENIGGIRVSKVDFDKSKTITINDGPYAREENFLQALKEFRRSL